MKEHLHHILLACAIGASSPSLAQSSLDIMLPEQIYGRVQVLDGSTIEFLNPRQPVRIAGYLAPRLEQNANTDGVEWPAGQVARAWLILRTLKRDVNCAPVTRDSNGTILAHCFVEETNLAATAIADGIGYAFNYPGEPQVPAYFDIERRARGLGFGIWSDPKLPPPWNYRPDTPAKPSPEPKSKDPEIPGLPLPPPSPGSNEATPRG